MSEGRTSRKHRYAATKEQYRRDYHQAAGWVTATEITYGDIAALAVMRRRHCFPNR